MTADEGVNSFKNMYQTGGDGQHGQCTGSVSELQKIFGREWLAYVHWVTAIWRVGDRSGRKQTDELFDHRDIVIGYEGAIGSDYTDSVIQERESGEDRKSRDRRNDTVQKAKVLRRSVLEWKVRSDTRNYRLVCAEDTVIREDNDSGNGSLVSRRTREEVKSGRFIGSSEKSFFPPHDTRFFYQNWTRKRNGTHKSRLIIRNSNKSDEARQMA